MENQDKKDVKHSKATINVEIKHGAQKSSESKSAKKFKVWKKPLVFAGSKTDNTSAKTELKSEDKKNRFGKKEKIIAGVAAILLVVIASLGTWAIIANNHKEEAPETIVEEPDPEPEPEPEVVENTDPLEPEPTINDNAAYQVAAHKPRYMSIPNIGIYNIPIVEVGKEGDNRLGSPNSDYVIAWYYRSALPGQPGASVMDGHGGDLGTGILKNLPRAAMGAEIIIEMGDGRKFTYIIEEKTYKPIGAAADSYMDVAYQPLRPGAPTIALITCTGKWLRAQQTYDQRLFVRASLRQ